MTTRRVDDWPERLAGFLEHHKQEPFVWGEHDCALFVADWVGAAWGSPEDLAERFRFRYGDDQAALRCLEQVVAIQDVPDEAGELSGFGKLLAGAVCQVLGDPLPTWRLAQRGDVVAMRDPDREGEIILGICVGALAVFLDVEAGLQRAPMARAALAWRV